MTPAYQDADMHTEPEEEPLLSDSQNAESSNSSHKEVAASEYIIIKTVSVMICFSTIGMCTAAVGVRFVQLVSSCQSLITSFTGPNPSCTFIQHTFLHSKLYII